MESNALKNLQTIVLPRDFFTIFVDNPPNLRTSNANIIKENGFMQKKEAWSKGYPAETITAADFADNIRLPKPNPYCIA